MELRPLGFGEIFDRAISLYVRNFLPFAGIVSVIIVPLAFVQYFLDLSSVPQWDQMVQTITHPDKTSTPPVLPSFLTSPGMLALFVLLVLVVWMLWPFALNACVVGVARIYRGRPVTFADCYRASLRRWPSVLGLLVIEAGIVLAWYLGLILVMVGSIFVVVLLSRVVVLAILAGIVAVILMIAAFLSVAPLIVALSFAMNSIVVEEQPAFAALALGFGRIFNRQEIGRAILFSLAAGAIMMGASALISALVVFAMLFHAVVLEVILTSLFRAAITPFSVVLLAVYYFDVRIRREGYEIEAGLDRLAAASQPASQPA